MVLPCPLTAFLPLSFSSLCLSLYAYLFLSKSFFLNHSLSFSITRLSLSQSPFIVLYHYFSFLKILSLSNSIFPHIPLNFLCVPQSFFLSFSLTACIFLFISLSHSFTLSASYFLLFLFLFHTHTLFLYRSLSLTSTFFFSILSSINRAKIKFEHIRALRSIKS